jgi:Tol biopolymer transport system component
MRFRWSVALAVTAAFAVLVPAASASWVTELVSKGPDGRAQGGGIQAASKDGSIVIFSTGASLVPADQDQNACPDPDDPSGPPIACSDIYVRNLRTGTTQLVSTGPAGGNGPYPALFHAASEDGRWVAFTTREALVSADTDHTTDVYVRDLATGTTQLVSTGPTAPGGAPGAFAAMSADGTRVAFITTAKATSEDTDTGVDVYVRDLTTGTTQLASVDRGSGYPFAESVFAGMSSDGYRVFFDTHDSLVPEDTDGTFDLYARDLRTNTTQLVTVGPSAPGGGGGGGFKAATADGSRVLFATGGALVPQDTDTGGDVYERDLTTGTTTLVSTGPQSRSGFDADFEGASPDLSWVAWSTQEPLVAADTDGYFDVYLRDLRTGTTHFVSKGPSAPGGGRGELGAVIQDGSVFFDSNAQLVPQDTDSYADVYRYDPATGQTTLVSAGSGAPGGEGFSSVLQIGVITEDEALSTRLIRHGDVSPDGRFVFFESQEKLVPSDNNGSGTDLYVRDLATDTTTLLSTGSTGLNGSEGFGFGGLAQGGRMVFFVSSVQLVPADQNSAIDLYASVFNRPPDCGSAAADRPMLAPANRSFRTVSIDGVTDPDGDTVSIHVDGVTQDEPVTGSGDRTAPDARLESDGVVRLRAERSAHGDGRVYRIAFTATDVHGESCSGTVKVSVPRNGHKAAIDSAPPSYDSLGSGR